MPQATQLPWLVTKASVCGLLFCGLGSIAIAQDATPSVDVKGNCNATISGGSSNVVNVYCGSAEDVPNSETTSSNTLVIHANGPTVLLYQPDGIGGFTPFQFYPDVVNFSASTFRLEIGDDVFRNDFVAALCIKRTNNLADLLPRVNHHAGYDERDKTGSQK
jgi:hypothetical protein